MPKITTYVAAPARPLLATPRAIRKTSNRLPPAPVQAPRLTLQPQDQHAEMKRHLTAILKLRQALHADLPPAQRAARLVDRLETVSG